MKRNCAAMMLAGILLLSLCACGKQQEEEPQIVGGWTEAEAAELSEKETEYFAQAVAGTEYEKYTPVSLLGTQVVAGTNYSFLCEDESGTQMILTVFRDLSKNCSVTQVEKP